MRDDSEDDIGLHDSSYWLPSLTSLALAARVTYTIMRSGPIAYQTLFGTKSVAMPRPFFENMGGADRIRTCAVAVLQTAALPLRHCAITFRLAPDYCARSDGARRQSARFSPESPVTTEARPPSPKSSAQASPGSTPSDELHCQPVSLIGPTMRKPLEFADAPTSPCKSSIEGRVQS
jgi:hypothetical protein